MFPGINPKQMQKAMKRMGVKQQEIDSVRVVIEGIDKKIIIENPSVMKVNMMGQESYQISGEEHEEALDTTPEISEDDIKTVVEQASVSENEARDAILKHKGNLAEAILDLKK